MFFYHSFLLASSISLVSSLASVIAILITRKRPDMSAIHIIPMYCTLSFIFVNHLFMFIYLNFAPINCGTFHIIFSNFVNVGFMPCD